VRLYSNDYFIDLYIDLIYGNPKIDFLDSIGIIRTKFGSKRLHLIPDMRNLRHKQTKIHINLFLLFHIWL